MFVVFEAWMEKARCRDADPEAFFVEKGGDVRPALRICAQCDVREECLEYGLNEPYGIFGGVTERNRRKLKR